MSPRANTPRSHLTTAPGRPSQLELSWLIARDGVAAHATALATALGHLATDARHGALVRLVLDEHAPEVARARAFGRLPLDLPAIASPIGAARTTPPARTAHAA